MKEDGIDYFQSPEAGFLGLNLNSIMYCGTLDESLNFSVP